MELLTANRHLLFNLNAILPASAALSTLFFFCPLKMILEQAAAVLKIIKNRRDGDLEPPDSAGEENLSLKDKLTSLLL